MALTLKDYAYTKPKNRTELALWVKSFLDWEITDSVRCNHVDPDIGCPHQTQLDYVASGFFDEYSSCVFMACRNGGKSYCAAIKSLLKSFFFPGIKIAVAAYQRGQSDFIYGYICDFLEKLAATIGEKRETIAMVRKDYIKFANGSLIQFFSGGVSKAGVKGCHPNILIVDEGDLFTQEQFDGIANALKGSDKNQRQFDVLSTNYKVSGEGVILRQIERLVKSANIAGMRPSRVFRICLLDILEKCDDRYQCQVKDPVTEEVTQECPLWRYCKGKAKVGVGGYLQVAEAYETLRDSSSQKFEAEMLLMRPSSEFTFFPNFSHARHVLDPEALIDLTQQLYLGLDVGAGRCPHAALLAQKNMTTGVYTVLDEWKSVGLLEDLLIRIKAKYPQVTRMAQCFCDNTVSKGLDTTRASLTPLQLLRREGFHPRVRPFKRLPTFMMLDALIDPGSGPPKLVINARCKNLIAQICAAEHAVHRGKPIAEPSNDILPDDHLDCLRYIVGWTTGNKRVTGAGGSTSWSKL